MLRTVHICILNPIAHTHIHTHTYTQHKSLRVCVCVYNILIHGAALNSNVMLLISVLMKLFRAHDTQAAGDLVAIAIVKGVCVCVVRLVYNCTLTHIVCIRAYEQHMYVLYSTQ